MAAWALERLEALLTGIYDLDTECRVEDFLVTDRQRLPGDCRDAPGDEQLFVASDGDELTRLSAQATHEIPYLDWTCRSSS